MNRSLLDFAGLVVTFKEYGVEFVSSTEKFDTSTPIGRAILSIIIVFTKQAWKRNHCWIYKR